MSPTVAALLERCVTAGASDLHIHPMSPPIVCVDGVLKQMSPKIWDAETTESVCRALCTEAQWDAVQQEGTVDFSIAHTRGERFRARGECPTAHDRLAPVPGSPSEIS